MDNSNLAHPRLTHNEKVVLKKIIEQAACQDVNRLKCLNFIILNRLNGGIGKFSFQVRIFTGRVVENRIVCLTG